jgi:hypothetical protein
MADVRPQPIKSMFEDIPSHLRAVTLEAFEHGTRSFTLTPDLRTIRFHLEPERAFISNLTVFVAHATLDRVWADTVASRLAECGFQITYLPVGGKSIGSNPADTAAALVREVTDADLMCLLLSENSAQREWIALEYAAAARAIGRVMFLRHPSIQAIHQFAKPSFVNKALLTTKYQLLEWRDDAASTTKLARLLINHPDEGVTNGTFRPLSVRERDLRRESVWLRYARLYLDEIPEYLTRHVVDVVPFSWVGCGVDVGAFPKAFEWLVCNHGRLNMAIQVQRQRWRPSLIAMPLNDILRPLVLESHLFALVLWKPEWNPAEDEVPNNAWV